MDKLYIIDCRGRQAETLRDHWFPANEGYSEERGELYVRLTENQVWGLERDHGLSVRPCPEPSGR